VDKKEIRSLDAFAAASKAAKSRALLLIYRDGVTIFSPLGE
jgi:hypothetical protein